MPRYVNPLAPPASSVAAARRRAPTSSPASRRGGYVNPLLAPGPQRQRRQQSLVREAEGKGGYDHWASIGNGDQTILVYVDGEDCIRGGPRPVLGCYVNSFDALPGITVDHLPPGTMPRGADKQPGFAHPATEPPEQHESDCQAALQQAFSLCAHAYNDPDPYPAPRGHVYTYPASSDVPRYNVCRLGQGWAIHDSATGHPVAGTEKPATAAGLDAVRAEARARNRASLYVAEPRILGNS